MTGSTSPLPVVFGELLAFLSAILAFVATGCLSQRRKERQGKTQDKKFLFLCGLGVLARKWFWL
jgi:hypothetical protein